MKVFLSHSKKDKELAEKIASDLKKNNIDIWFDEWEIFVGDSIIKKIQEGLKSCDFLSILFTRNSIDSNWVELEWQSLLYRQTKSRDIIILPIKGDDCEIPEILGDISYADLSKDYNSAIDKLIKSIYKHRKTESIEINKETDSEENPSNEIEVKLPNIDFNNFSDEKKEIIAKAISELLGLNYTIKITNVRKGSIIVRLKFPNEKVVKEFFRKLEKFSKEKIEIEDAWLYDESKLEIKKSYSNNALIIEATSKTPEIILDTDKGIGSIKGVIIPENSNAFFKPVFNWIDNSLNKSLSKRFVLNCNILYFNTTASKCILDMFGKFQRLNQSGWDIKINYYYEEDDEDMLEAGEDWDSILRYLPFKMIELKE